MIEVCYYIAEDGTRFDEKVDCEEYEFWCEWGPAFDEIVFEDENGNVLTRANVDDVEDIYQKCKKVAIHDHQSLLALKAASDEWYGWIEFDAISDIGVWEYNNYAGFVEVE